MIKNNYNNYDNNNSNNNNDTNNNNNQIEFASLNYRILNKKVFIKKQCVRIVELVLKEIK